ncbi:MAG: thiamine biosynthesis protein ThiS [Halobacteriota archaeon]
MENKGIISVTVTIKGQEHELTIQEGSNYEQLLLEMNVHPEEALVFVDGIPVPLDENVRIGKVDVLKIVSGG